MNDEPFISGVSQPSRLPLIIGVTGHIDLAEADLPHLKETVRSVFDAITSQFANTPIVVMSPLAEGADRLVAEVALEYNLELIAPLPFSIDTYKEDFIHPHQDKTEQSLQQFDHLLQQAKMHYVVTPSMVREEAEQVTGTSDERVLGYKRVCDYTAQSCHLLLALWDGVEKPGAQAGTSYTVAVKRRGASINDRLDHILDANDPGYIYHIVTPRLNKPAPFDTDYALRIIIGDKTMSEADNHKDPLASITMIDEFNRDVQRYQQRMIPSLPKAVCGEYGLIEEELFHQLPSSIKQTATDFATADWLSILYGRRKRLTLRAMIVFGALLVATFLLYGNMGSTVMLPVYLVIFTITCLIYYLGNSKQSHRKFIEYRGLAEGLRVRFYWEMAGLSDTVSVHYLSGFYDDLTWIKLALDKRIITVDHDQPLSRAWINNLQQRWIEGQLHYFNLKTSGTSKVLAFRQKVMNILFITTIVLTALLAVLEFIPWGRPMLDHAWVNHIDGRKGFNISIAVLAAITAMISNYNHKLALPEIARDYEGMQRNFAFALIKFREVEREIEKAMDMDDEASFNASEFKLKKICLELGKRSLNENERWMMIQRDRQVDLPQ